MTAGVGTRGDAQVARRGVTSRPWVCLMYHEVLPSTSASGGGRERFAVPVPAFTRMLDLIAAEGYRGCSVSSALVDPTGARVGITFDDGTIDQYVHAVPALLDRGMSATFYVTTEFVGRPGYMTWDHLRELKAAGMSVQSHTRTHPFLSELDADRLRRELVGSKAALDTELDQDTTELGLPGGDAPRRRLRPIVREAGYTVVAGSRWGRNDGGRVPRGGPVWVRRCTIRGDTPVEKARSILAGSPAIGRVVRQAALGRLRSTLGPSRYSRWRRRLLDTLLPS